MSFSGLDSWTVLSPIEMSIKQKIEAVGTQLKDWDISINYGIKTGYNDAFIISGAVKYELIAADPKSAELIRPILRGRDIKRYAYIDPDLWLIFIPWHFPLEKDSSITGASKEAEALFSQRYPAVYKHLLLHKDKLSKRNKAETGIRYEWYALQRWGAKYRDDFSKQKIIFQEMVQGPAFCLDNDKHFICLDTGRIIVGEKLEYLLGLLNSKLFFFAIKHFYGGGGLGGSGVRMKHTFFQQFSAYIPSQTEEEYFKKIAKDTISAEISADIDNFFYEKYALSTEEIDFIESDFN